MRIDYNLRQKLEKIAEKNEEIDKKQRELEHISNVFYRSPSHDSVRMATQSNNGASTTLVKIVQLSDEIDRLVDDYCDYRAECLKLLDEYEGEQREAIYSFYFEFVPIEDIAKQIKYSERQVRRLLF